MKTGHSNKTSGLIIRALPMNIKQHSRDMDNNSRNSEVELTKVQSFVGVCFNIMGAIRQPLIVLDGDLRILKANYSFYQMFNIRPEEAEGHLIYDLSDGNWDIPKLRELLEDILIENTE